MTETLTDPDACPPALRLVRLGLTRYADALAYQRAMHERRKAAAVPDTLILTEHRPVLTLGNRGNRAHLLVTEQELAARGIDLVHVERGGDVTYHGPGQLVAYPIVDLREHGRDVHRYIWRLEQTAIDLLGGYGLVGERRSGTPGVWVGARKIASVGVFISRWVTLHGIAINVTPDLGPFELIHPCGLVGMTMTSIAHETGRPTPLFDAEERYVRAFEAVFNCRVVEEVATPQLPGARAG